MRELRREIEINAPPESVWAVVSDFAAYPRWNPFIRRISGQLRVGAKLEVQIEPPGGRATTFKPTVRAVETNRELRWLGRLLLPGVIDGEHSLRIEPLDGGRSRFIQSERFTGLLVGLVGGTLAKTEVGFEQMNTALKAGVEDDVPAELNVDDGAYVIRNDGGKWTVSPGEVDDPDVVVTTSRNGWSRFLVTARDADTTVTGSHRAVRAFMDAVEMFPRGSAPATAPAGQP